MQPRGSIKQTKNYFHKTIKNFASFFLGRYQKITKPPLCNPFSCSSSRIWRNHHDQTEDGQLYDDFYCEWEDPDLNKQKHTTVVVSAAAAPAAATKEPVLVQDDDNVSNSGSFIKFANQCAVKNKPEDKRKNDKHSKSLRIGRREDQFFPKRTKQEESRVLAQKMKQLELMDAGDMDHVLDIEEAIHYYSRLKSPVYIDIVDKFLTDMHSEMTIPQAPISLGHSKRRFGSMRL